MPNAPPITLVMLLGLGFFFGLAFEEFYANANQKRPGGIRTFPLLALTGALLYRLDPTRLLPVTAGLLVLGIWLVCYYWRRLDETDAEGFPNVGLVVPVCNVLAYLLGPVALAEPTWVPVGATVAAVLLLTARPGLHRFAHRVELAEIVNAGKFLLLTGFALPLLPDTPVTDLTPITPHQVWLAMVAVCTVSYAGYLLQRYVAPPGGGLLVALLGGLYSSTATTLVLAKQARSEPAVLRTSNAGIVLATAVMYLRLLMVILVFNRALAMVLLMPLVGLSGLGLVVALGWYVLGGREAQSAGSNALPGNPLELTTAATFAGLFVVISIATAWATQRFGSAGTYALAAIVGVSDIDPFVLNLAQGDASHITVATEANAVLIAASSNNVVKAVYALVYSKGQTLVGAGTLLLLAVLGIAVAVTV
ncbi:MAG TPA: DUF4010 domain-containing protein [Acetobacteraceae bacterium]|jgi:uncharacterized membrane protein (DUF4010 family)|nr:DUF4010 domain-containing protein [Acetobacteraceae bacterium]